MEIDSIETIRALDPKGLLRTFTSKNTRPSARQHVAARPTSVVHSVLPRNTYGSSLVRFGDTKVLGAVTLSVGVPGPATPDEGDVVVAVTVGPICGRGYNLSGRIIEGEGGAHADDGEGGKVAASRADPSSVESHLQRVLRTSGLIDLKSLGLVSAKAAWRLSVNCVVLNDGGNLFDAGLVGCISALTDTRLPRTRVDDAANTDEGMIRVVSGDDPNVCGSGGVKLKLNMKHLPIPLTIGIFEDALLVDPDDEEERVLDGTLTLIVNSFGGIVSMDKRGKTNMSAEKLAACVHMARGRAKELEGVIKMS